MASQKSFAQEAQAADPDTLSQSSKQQAKRTKPPIVQLGDKFQNSILFLNNRFRVDSDVDELTMVFFREEGSAPVVLVRPDGSKFFIENDDENPDTLWFETQEYDMISIKKPMPGPWQAIGDILDGSKIMVIADIVLNAQAIPKNIYSGETIKQTAILENDGKKVDFSAFRDVISVTIDFVSNNNPNYENFGLGSRTIARFQDNGEGLDELAADGVFTGQFNLNIPSGEWRPTFRIRTPMYNREQIHETVTLHPNPIAISVKIDDSEQGEHIVTIDTDAKHISLSSLLLDGQVKRPNGEVDKVIITETSDAIKIVKVNNDSFGMYSVKLNAFATTLDGRELIIKVPEYTFITTAPPEPDPIPEQIITGTPQTVLPLMPIKEDAEEAWSAVDTIKIALTINFFILVFGAFSIFLILNKRKHPDTHLTLRFIKVCLGLLEKLKFRKSQLKNEDSIVSKSKTNG